MDLYHVLNRGVEKRNIFLEAGDYARFVHSLYEFNNVTSAQNTARHMSDIVSRSLERQPLVDIHAWCLMKNHYHLLLSEREEGGISKFIRKLNIGYAKFFNAKYERSGYLFQGRTKKIRIEKDAQFNYIFHYIHLNPLDYLGNARDWRIRSKGEIKHTHAALAYLKKYRWSSYLDYIGEKNFPSILSASFFKSSLDDYEKTLIRYLKGGTSAEFEGAELE